MALSQNGYSVPLSGKTRSATLTQITVPGGKLEVRKGDVATIFKWFATYYNAHVQTLHWPGNWGFNVRPVRGQITGYSNHASGTAIDLNAPLHPQGTRATSNFTAAQIAEVRRMLAYCGGVIRWGADYTSARPDPMHFEINASPARVHALALKISGSEKEDQVGTLVNGGTSKPQTLKVGATTELRITDTGHVSFVQGPLRVDGLIKVYITGLPGGDAVALRAFQVKPSGTTWVATGASNGIQTYVSSGGTLYCRYPVSCSVPAGQRLRLQISVPAGLPSVPVVTTVGFDLETRSL